MLLSTTVELTAKLIKTAHTSLCRLPKGTSVFLPWLPGEDHKDNVLAATILVNEGLLPVPHIVARNVIDKAHLETVIGDFRGALGGHLGRVLVLAGGRTTPIGSFSDSIHLLQTGLFQDMETLHCAVHPSGHSYASDEKLAESYKMKLQLASSARVVPISQLCLSAEHLKQCASRLNIDELLVGVAPRMDFQRLLTLFKNLDIKYDPFAAVKFIKGNANAVFLQDVIKSFTAKDECVNIGFHIYGLSSFKNIIETFDMCNDLMTRK